MNIAIDISYLQTKRAGYGHHTTELLNSLLKYGTQHTYTLWGWSYSLDRQTISKITNRNVNVKIACVPGIVKRFYWNNLKYPNIEFFTGEFDIFHSIEPLMPPTRNKKVIITVHDLAYKKYPDFLEREILRWDKYIKRNINAADAIVVQSNQTKNDISEYFKVYENKIHIIHLPVSSIFHNNPDDVLLKIVQEKYNLQYPFALFVGTLEPRKNITTLIKAFEQLHKEKKMELHLVIVGKRGWMYDNIVSSINNSCEKNKIHYVDYISESDLTVIYKLATFFVYPSLYEGYGVPVLEAMASGIPVITSNISSLKEIASEAALLIDPNNTEELANSMLTMTENSVLRSELSKKGLERIKLFDPKTASEEVLNIYNQLS
jgi:glycosyltransferase involved in cell wall biosynthesis